MAEPKAFASLGPTLLARKGSARPAMRPQIGLVTTQGTPAPQDLEDLGWNDLGAPDEDTPVRHNPLPLTPAPAANEAGSWNVDWGEEEEAAEEPAVHAQQRAIAESIAPAPQAEPKPAPPPVKAAAPKPAPAKDITPRPRRRRSALEAGRRAAFTLRLDAERHLKLRLASTLRNRSSQQIVTEALDRFLDQLPEVETLAAQVQREQSRS